MSLLLLRPPSRYRLIRGIFARGNTGLLLRTTDFSTLYQDSAGTTPVTAVEQAVGKAVDQSGGGNHLTQATDAARPILMSRVNLDTYSADFRNTTDAGATRPTSYARATITANAATAPNGAMEMDKIVEDGTASNTHYVRRLYGTLSDNTTYTFIRYLKAAERTWAYMPVLTKADTGGKGAYFDLANGVVGTVEAGATAAIEHVGGGIYKCSVTRDVSSGAFTPACDVRLATGDLGQTYSGDSSSGLYVWGADLRFQGDVTKPHQWITDSATYDTAGFQIYCKYETDDSMASATGGGSTTGFLYVAAVTLRAGGLTQTLFSDRGANTGYRVAIDTSNRLELTAGDGVGYTTVVSAALTVGTTYILSAWHDGTNLNVQVNNNAAVQAAFATATAGSAGFTLGKSNTAAADYLNARVYGDSPTYVKDWVYNAAQLQAIKQFHASYAGVTL